MEPKPMSHKPLTPEDIAEIRARESKATPGLWRVFNMATPEEPMQCVKVGTKEVALFCTGDFTQAQEDANADFIAAARTDIPRLLSHIDALQADACPPLVDVPTGAGDADVECSNCCVPMDDPHTWRQCAEGLWKQVSAKYDDECDARLKIMELQAENERLRRHAEELQVALDEATGGSKE